MLRRIIRRDITRRSPALLKQSLYLTRPAFNDPAFHMSFDANGKLLHTTVFNISRIVYATSVYFCLTTCATCSMRGPLQSYLNALQRIHFVFSNP